MWPAPAPYVGTVRLEPLTTALLELDTAAYLASPRAIAAHSAGRWSMEGFTEETNRALVAGHENEHANGEAFAHAILDLDRTRELGCAYLKPLGRYLLRTGTVLDEVSAASAILTFWAVDDEAARPAVDVLLDELLAWTAAWGAAPVVLRLLPEEGEALAAVEARGLGEVTAQGQELPYRWFAASA